ncbi:MAG: tyrosine-type recombinase/integrase [Alphaproteobacteria bacterium]
MLNDAMTKYVEMRRATGFKFVGAAGMLKSFVAFAEARGDEVVRAATVLDWAALAPSPQQRHNRLITVRLFALTVKAEDPRHDVPAPDAMGRTCYYERRVHIYTAGEISRLLQATAKLGPKDSIRPVMYTTLFGLLAATGLRVSEALALQYDDVTEDGLIIRETKFKKNRLVPLHETTRRVLAAYISVRKRHKASNDSLFINTFGRTLKYYSAKTVFVQLTRSIGLREAGRRGPRIHDFRHTFAVRSLEQCGCDRDEVALHMVALSTYMGHAHVTNTYWYMEATPILMRQIAEAAETMHQGAVQ